MAKIKLTKNELKKQKDSLKMFKRYLPTLMLKKQQLQSEIRGIEVRARQLHKERDELNQVFCSWLSVFGEEAEFHADDGSYLVSVKEIRTQKGNIAGVDIPLFKGADFTLGEYDLFIKPLWVDKAVEKLKNVMLFDLELIVLDEQVMLLTRELRITTQRVNLFEKVKIPETEEAIRRIRIYLGDQQTAAVVRGKMAKKNLERAVS